MSTKATPKPRKYVTTDRTADGRLIARGTLKRGLKVGEVMHKEFVMQEAIMEDLVNAENNLGSDVGRLGYDCASIAAQLISIGNVEGLITSGMIKKLRLVDFSILREAQLELDALGEAD